MSNVIPLYDIRRNREVVFVENIKELEKRIQLNSRTPYNIIRKSAILRLLFIDGSTLFSLINQNYQKKIRIPLKFQYRKAHSLSTEENSGSSVTTFTYVMDQDGDEVSISKFLELDCILINDPKLKEYLSENNIQEKYNVRELIKLIANCHGGVHFENWSNIPSFVTTGEFSPFNINVNSRMHEIIDNCASILLKGIEPLTLDVLNNLKTTKPVSLQTQPRTFRVKKAPEKNEKE